MEIKACVRCFQHEKIVVKFRFVLKTGFALVMGTASFLFFALTKESKKQQ
jgi:hypothetical protein